MTTDVLDYLKGDPRFRERKNKNVGIANLIMRKYGIELPRDKRNDIIGDILTADRSWRKHTNENPELRGKDYDEKEVLEQKAEINLGYTPGHEEDLKKLKTL